jgi:hypothetical protein
VAFGGAVHTCARGGRGRQEDHVVSYEIRRVEVWAGEIRDRRGALAEMLKHVLEAGADLDFIIARPSPVKPATGILYLAPLEGDAQLSAARESGLHPSSHIAALRVEGPDRPGLAEQVTRAIADGGINVSGFTGGRMAERCVMYIRFERGDDLAAAHQLLEAAL